MAVKIKVKGSYNKTEQYLKNLQNLKLEPILRAYGQQGVQALSAATPVKTGLTAKSWGYDIIVTNYSVTIEWTNTHVVNGVPIAIILQYGHGTNGGGYVQGKDYINPAIKPIFDKIAQEVWREVTK